MSPRAIITDLPHVVYHLYGAGDRLLYIGCTSNLQRRVGVHRSNKLYGALIVRIEASESMPFGAARLAEREAIQAEDPTFNKEWTARDLRMRPRKAAA